MYVAGQNKYQMTKNRYSVKGMDQKSIEWEPKAKLIQWNPTYLLHQKLNGQQKKPLN